MKKIPEFYKMIENNDIMNKACSNSLKPPEILYHYTSAEGLKGIVESGLIYASHFLYLNDPTEITYSLNMINGVIKEIIKSEENDKIKESFQICLDYDLISKGHYQGYLYDVFILSFSENGDQLSQWRGYADNGMGYSIGIDPSKIPNTEYGVKYTMNLNKKRPIYLIKVEYDPDKQKEIINDSFKKLLIKVKKCIIADNNANETPIFSNLTSIISNLKARLALLFKDQSYKEEQEWRYLFYDISIENQSNVLLKEVKKIPCIGIRNKRGVLTPYIKFDFKESEKKPRVPLKEIVIGPRLNLKNSYRSLEFLLFQKGYINREFPELKKSIIPYA